MSRTISASMKQRFGVERVCRAWGVGRASVYRHRQDGGEAATPAPGKRGPKTATDDAGLLAAIQADLAESPFRGEGHRKVHARLRRRSGIMVARKRVLRIMRENNLLSPSRVPKAPVNDHDGRITTDAPNDTWATDAAKVQTADDGWVWLFVAVEHWNGECVGWHVSKNGDRHAALEPLRMAVQDQFGAIDRDAARGLTLRCDNGSQYLAGEFREQMHHWGVALSYGFVRQPQTNGVAERFIRTLKEQAVHGCVFRTVEDVRNALDAFVQTYNAAWRLEKLAYQTPWEARAAWNDQPSPAREAA